MFIDPMLLATAPAPFSDSHYIFEPKIDEHRLLFSQQSGRIRLYTRHETECTQQYPELLVPFDDDILLDGEVACTGPEGVDFEEVLTRFKASKDQRIKHLVATSPITYVVFDILQYKNQDLRKMPLLQRKEILAGIRMPNQHFCVIPFVEGAGEGLFDQMVNRKLEGMVGKRKNSLWRVKFRNWFKSGLLRTPVLTEPVG
ncbi:ATP-dependent DNA ligase [Paenibacillus sp. LBL]|uniref:ATP-dependent DNA ligase n=1 Tax=Paenibacillus sp. LBL TaxID=2940563 RepID=UPI00247609C9|nr:hypothetical protein [Paenibacillus sp. LBL]MDH6673593.1 ATP-dependent DNA ligase [Paenibacillus sp. LBL]